MGYGVATIEAVGPHSHAAFWPVGAGKHMHKGVIGAFSWRVLVAGYKGTSQNGIDFADNWIAGEGS